MNLNYLLGSQDLEEFVNGLEDIDETNQIEYFLITKSKEIFDAYIVPLIEPEENTPIEMRFDRINQAVSAVKEMKQYFKTERSLFNLSIRDKNVYNLLDKNPLAYAGYLALRKADGDSFYESHLTSSIIQKTFSKPETEESQVKQEFEKYIGYLDTLGLIDDVDHNRLRKIEKDANYTAFRKRLINGFLDEYS
ncbi:hypothetical protein GF327_10100 [Candidatus Woesearchaeota archaeon]|nr:hypothetical protein [Candidatus Woesearchaeota archaeon]